MKFISIISVLIVLNISAFSQNNIGRVLQAIEQNNTTLIAFEKQQEAESFLNKTGISLSNPEFDFAWFQGNPGSIGNKTNISLLQSFDFPTSYIHKSKIANLRNEQLLPEYQKKRSEILLEARLLCLELIYTNAMLQEYEDRLKHARRIFDAHEIMLEAGQTNVLEHNKARLNLLNLRKQTERLAIEKNAVQNKLTGLNGGNEIVMDDTTFPHADVPADFEQWYSDSRENNPVLKWLRQEADISQKEEKLQRAMNLPGFKAGYVSEALTHEQFRGFIVGISIPLWENKNTMKYAQAHTEAIRSAEHDNNLDYYNFLFTHYSLAKNLLGSILEYQALLQETDTSDLLRKAWQEGQINLTTYLLELSLFYQGKDNLLEMQLELHQTLATLNQYDQ